MVEVEFVMRVNSLILKYPFKSFTFHVDTSKMGTKTTLQLLIKMTKLTGDLRHLSFIIYTIAAL